MRFAGQSIIVTGGSRGIGSALVLALAREGARVLFTYQRDSASAERTLAAVAAAGGTADSLRADASESASSDAMVAACLDRWGRVDGLVCNAGITDDAPFVRMSAAQWQRVIAANLSSVFYAYRAALPPMRAQRYGRIVSIGSLAGLAGNLGQANYAAAKSGLVGLTRALAREVAADGITANVVAPGYVETEMLSGISAAQRAWALNAIAIGRFATVDEVVPAISFLLGREASYITGQVLAIDGGWVMP